MRRYVLSRHPEVKADLEAIQDFIAPVAGVRSTSRIMAAIQSRMLQLRDLPHIGVTYIYEGREVRAVSCAEKAIICFSVDAEAHQVKVLCVTYAGQDWQALVKARTD